MTDEAAPLSALLERLAPSVKRALFDYAGVAVLTVNAGLGSQLAQPARAPSEAELWREALGAEATMRLVPYWLALEEADLRAAGVFLFHAILRQVLEQGSAAAAYLRQFSTQLRVPPDAAPPANPAPGSSA